MEAIAQGGGSDEDRRALHRHKASSCRRLPPPYASGMNADISYFARTLFRNQAQVFGIKQADRLSHMYIIGKTGTGKSTMLETIAARDLEAGRGFAFIDPHGDVVERLFRHLPDHRRSEVIYLDVPDPSQPYGYNPLRHVRADKVALAASGLLETFKKLWDDAWGVRMEHIFRNALLALLEREGSILPDILRMLTDPSFRKASARDLKNDQVRTFWLSEFERYSPRFRADAIAPIQNKVGAFLADPTLHRILTAPKDDLRFRRIMDEGCAILVNLAKGRIGEDSSTLLGALLVTTIGLAAFTRADEPQERRRPFFLYIDEFQSFTTLSVATMASELRKYGVGLILANQHLHQLEPDIRSAVLGNAGTLISFRVGSEDAAFLAREFQPKFETIDLLNLPNHHIYLKLMIDGAPSQPFSATSLRTDQMTRS